MSLRDYDSNIWDLAFGIYATDRDPLIRDIDNCSYITAYQIPVTQQLIDLLPQLQHYDTVYPHILYGSNRYSIFGRPKQDAPCYRRSNKRFYVCAAYCDINVNNYNGNTDNDITNNNNNCNKLYMSIAKTHSHLQITHKRVHEYCRCIGGPTKLSICQHCNTTFTNPQRLAAHFKSYPDHRTKPVQIRRHNTNQSQVQLDNNVLLPTDIDITMLYAPPPSDYTPVDIDRTAFTNYLTPLIRVEQLTMQYTDDQQGTLFNYIPTQCNKVVFNIQSNGNNNNIIDDIHNRCSITLSGKRKHLVWSSPLPYYVLVQHYHCRTHSCTFNSLRHRLPDRITINPDIMAVGSSADAFNGEAILIDRAFYTTIILHYVEHFNATSVHDYINDTWRSEWLAKQQQHNRMRQWYSNYTDPGIDPDNPHLYYKLSAGTPNDTPEQLLLGRGRVIDRYVASLTAPSADTINNLFYNHYVPYELKHYIDATTLMVHQWGANFIVSDHTFHMSRNVHVYDPPPQYGERRSTTRPLVKCTISTVMDLVTDLIISALIVPSTSYQHVGEQIDSYLAVQSTLPVSERRTLHSVGVDNAVSFGGKLSHHIHTSQVKYKLLPDNVLLDWSQHIQCGNGITQFIANHYKEYSLTITEDVWHLKQRVLNKGSDKHHIYYRKWRTYVDSIFSGVTQSTYTSADHLTDALYEMLYIGCNPSSYLHTVIQYGKARIPVSYKTINNTTSPLHSCIIHKIHTHQLNDTTLHFEYSISTTDSIDTIAWYTYEQIVLSSADNKTKLINYLAKLDRKQRPLLNHSGRQSINLMINNVQHIYGIILLRQKYDYLQRNSGTNILEARHSVMNSMRVKKGTIVFEHMKQMVNIRTLQHNLRRLLKLAKQQIPDDNQHVDNNNNNNNNNNNDSIQVLRIKRLRQHLVDTFSYMLPPLQSSDTQVLINSHKWLPVQGHPHGYLFRPWSIAPFTMYSDLSPDYKIYRSKRLGDISAIDLIHMVLQFYTYHNDENNNRELNQDVTQLKHHLASKIFNNKRTVEECEYLINTLGSVGLGYATIHSLSNTERDRAAIQCIIMFTPSQQSILTDNQAAVVFNELVKLVQAGPTNRQRIKLLFQHINLFTQLTVEQLNNNIQHHIELDGMILAINDTNNNSYTNNNTIIEENEIVDIADIDLISVDSDISDGESTPTKTTPTSSRYNTPN